MEDREAGREAYSSCSFSASALGNRGQEDDEGFVRAVELGGADHDGLALLERERGGDQIARNVRSDSRLALLRIGSRPRRQGLFVQIGGVQTQPIVAGGASRAR